MDYQFTVLTVSQPITTRSSGGEEQAPWSNLNTSTVISMPGATLSTITLSDDDGAFQSGRYAPDSTGQTLTTAVTFGNDAQPTQAGTALSFHNSTIIRTANPDGSYDEFRALFPRKLIPGAIGTEMGGRYSVLLMPVVRADGTYPTFSLAKSYTVKTFQYIGRANDSTGYVPAAVPCFGMGTRIATSTGPRRVETLRPGDLVLTRDRGLQPLRWQGGSHVTAEGLAARPNLRPILISKDALGPGSPDRDLVVSPQHRVLIRSRIAHKLFKDGEILVAAKHLVGLPGIEVTSPPGGITYVHLLFDRHEIVMSEGAWSESLFTGPQALESVSTAARQEIFTLFPDLAAGQIPQPARRLLTGREARQLAERQRRNLGRRQLVEPL